MDDPVRFDLDHEHPFAKALRSALACFGWHTMDSALRDGTPILLVAAGGDMLVAYHDRTGADHPWVTLDGPRYSEAFFTHWQHLPSPPDRNKETKT